MMNYLNLLANATDCLWYGILLAAVTMIILYFILQMVSKTCVKTIPFYIAGVILAPLLMVQDTLIVAAFQAKGMVDALEIEVQQIVGAYDQSAMNLNETQAVLDQVTEDFPLVGYFVNLTNAQVENAQQLASVMAEGIRDYLNTYLWKRFGWCTAFIAIAVLVVFMFDKQRKYQGTTSSYRSTCSGSTTSYKDYDNF
ncbi:MAG: hypothetical protein IJR02_10840 [Bacteroidaceae bacterium]|nr:hypothetical protein [Bacteroidaceae bacterium]